MKKRLKHTSSMLGISRKKLAALLIFVFVVGGFGGFLVVSKTVNAYFVVSSDGSSYNVAMGSGINTVMKTSSDAATSLQWAISNAPSFSSIFVKAGTYPASHFVQLYIDLQHPVFIEGEGGTLFQRIGIVIGSLSLAENVNLWKPILKNVYFDGVDYAVGSIGIWMSGALHTAWYDVTVTRFETGIKLLGAMWVNDFYNLRVWDCQYCLQFSGMNTHNEVQSSIAELTFFGGHIGNVFSLGQVTTVTFIGTSIGPSSCMVELIDSYGYNPSGWIFSECRFESYTLGSNMIYIHEQNDPNHVGGMGITFDNCKYLSNKDCNIIYIEDGQNIKVINPIIGGNSAGGTLTVMLGDNAHNCLLKDPSALDGTKLAYVDYSPNFNNTVIDDLGLLR